MFALIISTVLLGQSVLDPDTQQQKEWLLANLITSLGFDTNRMMEVERHLDGLSPSQIRILVQIYKTKLEERNKMLAQQQAYYEQSSLNQAQLNLERAKAYRDQLGREYQYSITVKQQEMELMRRATYYQNWALQNQNNGYGHYRSGHHHRYY